MRKPTILFMLVLLAVVAASGAARRVRKLSSRAMQSFQTAAQTELIATYATVIAARPMNPFPAANQPSTFVVTYWPPANRRLDPVTTMQRPYEYLDSFGISRTPLSPDAALALTEWTNTANAYCSYAAQLDCARACETYWGWMDDSQGQDDPEWVYAQGREIVSRQVRETVQPLFDDAKMWLWYWSVEFCNLQRDAIALNSTSEG